MTFEDFRLAVNVVVVVTLLLMAYTHLRMWWLTRHPETRKTWLPRWTR